MTTIDRRELLRRSGICVAGLVASGLALPRLLGTGSAAAAGGAPAWGYEGRLGPEHWGSLDPHWHACATGAQQSPIDLPRGAPSVPATPQVRLRYRPGPVQVVDTGHAIEFLPGARNRALVDGRELELVQFHEHNPSEHTRRGRHFPAELHFVHASADGSLAVLGVLLVSSSAGAPADELLHALPEDLTARQELAGSFDVSRLFPRNGIAFRYPGSLTTPDCGQGVDWFVFAAPVPVHPRVIEAFRRANPGNSRPVQPLHGRIIRSARIG